jgi:long-chain acyl-CoA synthetase
LPDMQDTLPKLLLRNYERWGDTRVALRKKEYGIWREYSWKDCYLKVKSIFLGLTSVGLEAGSGVAILGDSSPEWFWCELAVQAARGVPAGLNPAGSEEETKGLAMLARAQFVLAQDQEQVDKLLEVKSELPSLQRIVYWNEKGLRHYDNPLLVSLAEVIRLGEEHEKSRPGEFERRLAHGRGNDVAMLIFTLGANDSLKIVPATHSFLISSVESALTRNPVYDTDDYVSVRCDPQECWRRHQAEEDAIPAQPCHRL